MSRARIDQMMERAAECICDARCDLSALPMRLARDWPEAPALELTVALASAAEAVQAMLQANGPSGARAQIIWQQAALVAAEVHFLTVTDAPHATAGDLLRHWQHESEAE